MLNINRALNNGTFTENWFTDVEQLICLNPNINLQIVKKKKKKSPKPPKLPNCFPQRNNGRNRPNSYMVLTVHKN